MKTKKVKGHSEQPYHNLMRWNESAQRWICGVAGCNYVYGEYRCSRCGADNAFVNQCGCDPDNLPTRGTKFTPGPWHVTGGNVWSDTRCIAKPYTYWPKYMAEEEVKANVRLLAAAPELLEACKDALAALDCIADGAGDVPDWNEGGEYYAACDKLRCALARAEGDSR